MHGRLQRQHDERDHDVAHADHHAGQVVHHFQRGIDDAHGHQRLVDHPRALQQHQPRVGACQQAGPHRQQYDVQQPAAPALGHQGNCPGQREAQQHADQGDHAGHREGVEQHPRISRVGKQLLVVAQARRWLQHPAQQQAGQRGKEEQAKEQQGRQQIAAAFPALAQADAAGGRSRGAGARGGTLRVMQGVDGDFHLTNHSFQRAAMAWPFLAQ
ncbi:hypothetical protein D3C78_1341870 [compost metagenome]